MQNRLVRRHVASHGNKLSALRNASAGQPHFGAQSIGVAFAASQRDRYPIVLRIRILVDR